MAQVILVILVVALLSYVCTLGLGIGLSRIQSRKSISNAAQNAELVRVLLDLDEERREDLFRLYREQFGEGASRYARQTYLKWKDGTVRPNKQTFNRLLINLPKVMSFDLKCEVLRKLREAYCAKDNFMVDVHIDDWDQTLAPLVKQIITKASEAELPEKLKARLIWLAEDDVQVANAILNRSQTEQSLNALSLLEKEFSSIDLLLDNAAGKRRVSHELKLPSGSITVRIKKR